MAKFHALASIALVALGLASSAAAQTNTTTTITTTTTTPITTAKTEKTRERARTAKGLHCVTDLSKPTTPATCYDTFTAATAAATGGQITDAPADPQVAMNDQRLLARMNAGDGKKSGDKKSAAPAPAAGVSVPVGTIFYYTRFRGSSLTYTAPHGCDDDLFPSSGLYRTLAPTGMTTSSQPGATINCGIRVFEHRDFRGNHTYAFDYSYPDLDLYGLEDEGSSLQFT
jgi:hypothetical protein